MPNNCHEITSRLEHPYFRAGYAVPPLLSRITLLVLILVLFVLLPTSLDTAAAFQEMDTPPDFELKTIDGKDFRLIDLKGELILLKLTATWCIACNRQTDEISDAKKFLKKYNVSFVEVFFQDTAEVVRGHSKGIDVGVEAVRVIDDGQVLRKYQVEMIPRLLLIDREFNIRLDGSILSAREIIRALQRVNPN